MAEKNLDTLFHDTLKDIYYAERTILKALPKMARGAEAPELKQAFQNHKSETEVHVERLQQVFEIIGKRAQGKTCPAIDKRHSLAGGRSFIVRVKDAVDAGQVLPWARLPIIRTPAAGVRPGLRFRSCGSGTPA